MDLRQDSLSSLRELIRRAGRDRPNDAERDYQRQPQQAPDAPVQNATGSAQQDRRAGPPADDWSGTLDLVLRASEKLVASEERVRDLEAEVRELTESASQEIEQLRAQVADLQRQLNDAEAGRRHAEDWLRRLNDAVRERFRHEAAQDREAPAAQAS